jgi:hypothetical protein
MLPYIRIDGACQEQILRRRCFAYKITAFSLRDRL